MTRDELRDRRYEAVALAVNGRSLSYIAKKLQVSKSRVQQMMSQQAGSSFYQQIGLERGRAKWAHYEYANPGM